MKKITNYIKEALIKSHAKNNTKQDNGLKGWVDLDLPSGNLWAKDNLYGNNEMIYDDINIFKDEPHNSKISLPTSEDWEELFHHTFIKVIHGKPVDFISKHNRKKISFETKTKEGDISYLYWCKSGNHYAVISDTTIKTVPNFIWCFVRLIQKK